LRATAAEECRRAACADHLRDFRWSPEYRNLNWTQLLLPACTTYYLDDDRNPQPVLIHGRSGQTSGSRRASMKRAQRVSLIMAAAAIVIAILSLVVMVAPFVPPDLSPVATIGIAVALVIGLFAILPIVIVWRFNRSQQR
jgi:hypothetical protein